MTKIIFLDDGGVLNDNALREPQWRDLVAQFFVPRYGGTKDDWKSANSFAFNKFIEKYEQTIKDSPLIEYNPFIKTLMDQWVNDMFKIVQINPPPSDERFKLTIEAEAWITPRVKSTYPGMIPTIFELKARGYTLCTASGESSWTLKGYLTGMGVIECFTRLYGPDLINTLKGSTVYYQRIVDDMKISPVDAVVIDDSSTQLKYAKEVGFTTVHVLNSNACEETSCDHHINKSREILDIIEQF